MSIAHPTCVSIRAKSSPGEQCTNKAKPGTEWCGKHQTTQIRFVPPTTPTPEPKQPEPKPKSKPEVTKPTIRFVYVEPGHEKKTTAVCSIQQCWNRWIARRCGPLLHFREKSNNPYDFFSADAIVDIPLRDFVSFVTTDGKGYSMDIKSANSLLEFATKSGKPALNPFNRAPLPPSVFRRVRLHKRSVVASASATVATISWTPLVPHTDEQRDSLETTDVFQKFEAMGYYTDPAWFLNLTRVDLQRFYVELADIWNHRAGLSPQDRERIVPGGIRPFQTPISTLRHLTQKALRPILLKACSRLTTSATATSDRQLGVLYVLGSLALLSEGARIAYPGLMFTPGVTRQSVTTGEMVVDPAVHIH